MQRFAPYLGIAAALLVGALFIAFFGDVAVYRVPAAGAPTASSTLTTLPGLILPPLTLPSPESEASVATTTPPVQDMPAPKKVVTPAPKPVAAPEPVPVAVPVPVVAPTPVFEPAALDRSAAALRAALVNIICYVPAGSGLHSISGSGVIVDAKGFILTNAHIAQYFLLTDRGVDCTVRAGSPAADRYDARLAYIPSAWLVANADVLTQTAPSGTGEHDFAFLSITGSATSAALPVEFPSLPLAQVPPPAGTPVVIASYGAQFLASSQVQSSLFPTIVFGSVKEVYTFVANTIDVLALGGSAAAQEGSSGGGVADVSGELVGTITTSTIEGATDSRSLDAITASYIRSAYASATGGALDLLLAKSPATAAADFAPQIPALEAILTANLP